VCSAPEDIAVPEPGVYIDDRNVFKPVLWPGIAEDWFCEAPLHPGGS
jgi:hypothetical protein